MKKFICAMVMVLFASLPILAQSAEANRIVGNYMTDKNKAKVNIFQKNNKYFGTIVWMSVANALDKKNPDKAEQTKKIVGKMVLKNFSYSGKNVWEDGSIYDPESGKTYSCKITRLDNGNLKVRGFIGVSLLGRNTEWKLVK